MSRKYPLLNGITEMVVTRGSGPSAVSVDVTVEEINKLNFAARLDLFGSAQFPTFETHQASLIGEQPPTLPSIPRVLISEAIQKYCDMKINEHKWTVKTSGETRMSMELLIHVLGDIPIYDINADMAADFFRSYTLLPVNWHKNPEYRNKTAAELTSKYKNMNGEELMRELLENPLADPLAPATINKNMDRISTLCKWAEEKEYVRKNFFRSHRVRDDSVPDEERESFQPEHLRRVFATEIFTTGYAKKAYWYWSPLIALLSGMRQNEIAQLYLDDIRIKDDVWVFDNNKSRLDKKLKNKYSIRVVPIHSFLLDAGLIQYRDSLKAQGQLRLFPELNFCLLNGYGSDISDWFAKYRQSIGIGAPRSGPVFHSFRHATITELLNADDVQEAIVAKLVGHEHKQITFGRYGKKLIEKLKETIEKLNFKVLSNTAPWTVPSSDSYKPRRVKPVINVQAEDIHESIFSKSLAAARNH